MRIPRLALVPLLATFAVSTLADALSDARPLLPPRLGTPAGSMTAQATDGTNFLFTAGASFGGAYAVIVAPDGTQLSEPVTMAHFAYRWAGGYYFAYSSRTFVRLTADGHRVDVVPRPMPEAPRFTQSVVSNRRRLLIYYTNPRSAYLLGPDGVAVPFTALPDGTILTIVGGDGYFLISYRPAGSTAMHLRLIDDRGETVRDARYDGISAVSASDGFTWYAESLDGVTASFLDNEFRPVSTFPLGGTRLLSASPGRGYLTRRIQRPLGGAGEATLLEFRAPAYAAKAVYLPLLHSEDSGPYIWGNNQTLFVHGGTVANPAFAVGRIGAIEELTRLYPTVSLTLRNERHRAAAATNRNGTTLVAWNETTPNAGRMNVYASRIDATGRLLDPAPLLLVINECSAVELSVTTNGTDFLVGWHGCSNVGADLITAGGTPVPSFRTTRSGESRLVATHFDGRAWLLHWRSANHNWLLGIRPDGTAVTPARQLDYSQTHFAPRRGGGYLVFYRDNTQWKVAPLEENLRIGDGGVVIPLDSGSGFFSFNAAGDRFLLTTRRNDEIRAMWLDANGQILGPIPTATFSVAGMNFEQVVCETACSLLWAEEPATAPARILAAPILSTPANAVALGEPVELVRSDDTQPVREPRYFHGTPDDPRLLIQNVWDLEESGMQLFVHTPPKRRAARR